MTKDLDIRDRLGLLIQHADDKQRWTTKEIAEAALVRIDVLEAALRQIARFEHPTPTPADTAGDIAREALEASS